ncbi:hypothetical protein ACFL5O_12035 [Myxococcota bacterium]
MPLGLATVGCGDGFDRVTIGNDTCAPTACGETSEAANRGCQDGSTVYPVCAKGSDGLCAWQPATCPDACESGATKLAENGCNECTCDGQGSWLCTQRDCQPSCVAGTTRPAEDECNTCTCSDDGEWSCTSLTCEPECGVGATRPAKDGCNTCTCEDGVWACAEGVCHAECVYYGASHTDGSTFPATDGCNTCTCRDGRSICTQVNCESACVAGKTRPAEDGCNTCTCGDEGKWVCTEKACFKDCIYQGTTYEDGASFPGECASAICSCLAGEVICDAMSCGPFCEPGATKAAADGCNTCTCNATGEDWQCTAKACDGETDVTVEIEPGLETYSAMMSSVPGLPLTPVTSGSVPLGYLYRWRADYGNFLLWGTVDSKVRDQGSDFTLDEQTVYWSYLSLLEEDTEYPPVVIRLDLISGSGGESVASDELIVDWNDQGGVTVSP